MARAPWICDPPTGREKKFGAYQGLRKRVKLAQALAPTRISDPRRAAVRHGSAGAEEEHQVDQEWGRSQKSVVVRATSARIERDVEHMRSTSAGFSPRGMSTRFAISSTSIRTRLNQCEEPRDSRALSEARRLSCGFADQATSSNGAPRSVLCTPDRDFPGPASMGHPRGPSQTTTSQPLRVSGENWKHERPGLLDTAFRVLIFRSARCCGRRSIFLEYCAGPIAVAALIACVGLSPERCLRSTRALWGPALFRHMIGGSNPTSSCGAVSSRDLYERPNRRQTNHLPVFTAIGAFGRAGRKSSPPGCARSSWCGPGRLVYFLVVPINAVGSGPNFPH